MPHSLCCLRNAVVRRGAATASSLSRPLGARLRSTATAPPIATATRRRSAAPSSTSLQQQSDDDDDDDDTLPASFAIEVPFPGVCADAPFGDDDGTGGREATPRTHVTRLPSGLRVVSQETYTYMTAIGAVVDAGSALEFDLLDGSRGATLMAEALAWSGTLRRSQKQLLVDVDEMGGYVHANAQREQLLYCVDVLREHAEDAAALLAEAMLLPDLRDEAKFEEAKAVVNMARESATQDALVRELAHAAAYGGEETPLGASLYDPDVTLKALIDFRAAFLTADRVVIAATGIEHSQLVEWAQKYFEPHLPSSSSSSSRGSVISTDEAEPSLSSNTVASATLYPSAYRPSVRTIEEAVPLVPGLAREVEDKVRVAVACETDGGWHAKDLVAVSVLQTLLGGGDSFSAGGPGKGMYSRLYREVLNYNHWVDAAECFVSVHAQTGLLGIVGASHPRRVDKLVELFCQQIRKLGRQPVSEVELSRAKNMLKCNVLTHLESRLVLFEDLARQFATYDRRQTLAEMTTAIDAVSVDDILRVGKHLNSQPVCLAAHGPDLSLLPSFDRLQSLFNSS